MATTKGRPRGGRMQKQDEALHDALEEVRFDLREDVEILEHLDALEKGLAEDVVEARKHLEAAEKRQELGLARIATVRRRLINDYRILDGITASSGWAHQLRPEVRDAAAGALAAVGGA